jgi:hypothetical protein
VIHPCPHRWDMQWTHQAVVWEGQGAGAGRPPNGLPPTPPLATACASGSAAESCLKKGQQGASRATLVGGGVRFKAPAEAIRRGLAGRGLRLGQGLGTHSNPATAHPQTQWTSCHNAQLHTRTHLHGVSPLHTHSIAEWSACSTVHRRATRTTRTGTHAALARRAHRETRHGAIEREVSNNARGQRRAAAPASPEPLVRRPARPPPRAPRWRQPRTPAPGPRGQRRLRHWRPPAPPIGSTPRRRCGAGRPGRTWAIKKGRGDDDDGVCYDTRWGATGR